MGRLAGKAALITGGASGIGRAQAMRFAAEGATVVVGDLDGDAARAVAEDIGRSGGRAFAAGFDVANREAVDACVEEAVRQMGGIDILSNTAGMMDGQSNVLDTSPESWERVLSVNLSGMFIVTRAVLPHMIAAGGGVVLNIGSGASFRGGMGGIAYTSAKHGVVGFTRQLTAEYGRQGIRSVGIAPGMIDTPMVSDFMADPMLADKAANRPAGRVGTPEDVANAALFLVSDESDFIHGVTIPVDGGRLAVA